METTYNESSGGNKFEIKRAYFKYVDKFATPEATKFVSRVSEEAVSINEDIDSRQGPVVNNNPGLLHILDSAPQIADWQKIFKKNAWQSLGPFYRPDGNWITQKNEPLGQATKVWLTDQLLGKELRYRAALEQQLVLDSFSSGGNDALILASGSGVYPIQAAHQFQESASAHNNKNYKKPRLTMVDINPRAIRFAKDFARYQDVKAKTLVRDILHTKGFRSDNLNSLMARSIKDSRLSPVNLRRVASRYDTVTMIGLSMYLPDGNFPYSLEKKLNLGETNLSIIAEAEKKGLREVLKDMWDRTEETMIFDIIRMPEDDEKGRAVSLQHKIIEMMGWPPFQLRTIDDALGLISELEGPPVSVEVYESPLDFFAVFKVNKHKQ